jgi:type III secretory pathway component EscR
MFILVSSQLIEGAKKLKIKVMNAILNKIIEQRKGMYVHALEVSNVYELQSSIEQLYAEFIEEFSVEEIVEFFNSMELYCLIESEETEVYDFDITEYIKSL